MSDWVQPLELGAIGSLSMASEGSIIAEYISCLGNGFGGTVAWPTANLALYYPVLVRQITTLYGAFWVNGATASGNVDAGVYDSSKTRVASVGSTAQSGASVIQAASITATTLNPGLYYLAMAMDNTTGIVQRASVTAANSRCCGAAQQATAFALPSSATFATNAQTIVPLFGFFTESSTF